MSRQKEKGDLAPLVLLGGVFGLWLWTTRAKKEEKKEGLPPEELPLTGDITLEFEPPENPQVKPMTPVAQFLVLRNGTSEPRELVVLVEAQHVSTRLWREVASSTPLDVGPGEEERFVLPAFVFEPHPSHRGSWHFRGTVWDETGKVIVVKEHRGLYTVV